MPIVRLALAAELFVRETEHELMASLLVVR